MLPTITWPEILHILLILQHIISTIGILIIFSGVAIAFVEYIIFVWTRTLLNKEAKINKIRSDLGRVLLLGLEFIVAADLIGSTTTPDYYDVGILAIIVLIRTLLSYSLTKEMGSIHPEPIIIPGEKASNN